MNAFFKKFKNDVKAIGFLGIGLFLALALASYNAKDPSFNSVGHGLKTLNYCGILGSFIADMTYQLLGLPAWLFVAGLFNVSLLSFQGRQVELKNIRVVWLALLICGFSALASIYWPNTKIFENQIYLGGLIGVGFSSALIKVLNSIRTQVLL